MSEDPSSIGGRAANDEGAEPEPELFPDGFVEGDEGVTHKTLIRPGLPIELKVSLTRAEIPSRGKSLFTPGREAKVLVTVEPGVVHEAPVMEGDRPNRKVTGWKLTQDLRSVYAERVTGDSANIEAEFALLMDGDPRKAGELLDKLSARLSTQLQAA